jgi:hypothetical protein
VGILVTVKYKYHSRAVDKITSVFTNRYYKKDELVLRLYYEHHSLQEHIEFGFNHNGENRYLDFVYYDNEAMYIKLILGEKQILMLILKILILMENQEPLN